MPKFAANLHYLFSELPFLDRFEAAANAGFKAVEFQVPYDYPTVELSARLRDNGLQMVLFDAPMGNWDKGDRGLAAVPGREQEFRNSLSRVVEYGAALPCETVHLMAGVVGPGQDYAVAERTYVSNLRHAATLLADQGIAGVIEPINKKMGIVKNGPDYTTEGMHGYFLNHTAHARRVLAEVGSANLFLHLDCYHMQMLEGNLAETLRENIGQLRHLQIAGVPGRHEPDVGEISYPYLFKLLDDLGYQGWVGCEYRPKGETRAGLGWAAPYGIHATKPVSASKH
ncbi:MAG TPA: 2-oxo-tetronate isomerase [Burkholderiales bacterium]|nr:2-oxo-tetronate isomerase [Burkholderiales bacterium]